MNPDRRSAETNEGQNGKDDHNHADNPKNIVHRVLLLPVDLAAAACCEHHPSAAVARLQRYILAVAPQDSYNPG